MILEENKKNALFKIKFNPYLFLKYCIFFFNIRLK